MVVREKADDEDDSESGWFPIASASDSAKNRKLTKAVFRRALDVLSSC